MVLVVADAKLGNVREIEDFKLDVAGSSPRVRGADLKIPAQNTLSL